MTIQLRSGEQITATEILFNPGETFISCVDQGPETFTLEIDDIYAIFD